MVHEAIDAALADLAGREPALDLIARPAHRRTPLIEQDLAALGVPSRPHRPLGATERFVGELTAMRAANPVALVGVLYVVEGATNGNKVIAKGLQAGLGLAAGQAMGYLDPHGAEQRKRWMEFKAGLDTLPVGLPEREAILAAARRTFQYFLELSPELDAALGEAASG